MDMFRFCHERGYGMAPVKAFSRIITDETLQEKAQHGSRDYPFQYYYEDIWDFDFHCIDWHWHPELELVYVQSGRAVCFVGEEKRVLAPGSALLINSRIIHRMEAEESTVIPNAVFSPFLLAPEESLIYRKYVYPFLSRGKAYQCFDPSVPWQEVCIRLIRKIFDVQGSGEMEELRTAEYLLALWNGMYPYLLPDRDARISAAGRTNQARLQIMMQYIQEHYRENIRLEDIAETVHVGRSSALQIFHQGIRQSPVAYLIQYRLKQAALLLAETEKKISAIAEETGFESAGYFCRKFKELYGTSPLQYRKW